MLPNNTVRFRVSREISTLPAAFRLIKRAAMRESLS